jgi:hypothetical protein
MGLLEDIRNKPHEAKVRMIWICVAIVVALLVLVWILVGQMKLDSSNSFLGTISNRIGHPSKTFPQLFNREE